MKTETPWKPNRLWFTFQEKGQMFGENMILMFEKVFVCEIASFSKYPIYFPLLWEDWGRVPNGRITHDLSLGSIRFGSCSNSTGKKECLIILVLDLKINDTKLHLVYISKVMEDTQQKRDTCLCGQNSNKSEKWRFKKFMVPEYITSNSKVAKIQVWSLFLAVLNIHI